MVSSDDTIRLLCRVVSDEAIANNSRSPHSE